MKVYVKTPARLHLGLIDLNGDLGRLFGGIGLGIDRPNFVLEASLSNKTFIMGERAEKVETLIKRFFGTCKIKASCSINIKEAIPEHSGLGSGTQLALAVATALSMLSNLNKSVQDLAEIMGRGKRTSIGTTIFEQGGFVVDGGKNIRKNSFPITIFRQNFPKSWVFVVAIPNVKKGLANKNEKEAFRKLSPMTGEDVGRICRLTMIKLLPSLLEQDIKSFGEALTEVQRIVGDHFANVQGGTFSSAAATEGIELMRKLGVYGIGQSSWGPAFYGLTSEDKAKGIKQQIQSFIRDSCGGQVFVAKANNRGAYIKVSK